MVWRRLRPVHAFVWQQRRRRCALYVAAAHHHHQRRPRLSRLASHHPPTTVHQQAAAAAASRNVRARSWRGGVCVPRGDLRWPGCERTGGLKRRLLDAAAEQPAASSSSSKIAVVHYRTVGWTVLGRSKGIEEAFAPRGVQCACDTHAGAQAAQRVWQKDKGPIKRGEDRIVEAFKDWVVVVVVVLCGQNIRWGPAPDSVHRPVFPIRKKKKPQKKTKRKQNMIHTHLVIGHLALRRHSSL